MSVAAAIRAKAMKKEPVVSSKLPYEVHLDKHTVMTKERDYLQVIKLTGASYESADDEQVNTWHKRLNQLFKTISSHNVAIWQHVVRRREDKYPPGEFPDGFAKDLNDKYSARLATEKLRINELYITIVYRPFPNAVSSTLFNFMAKADSTSLEAERIEAVDELNKVVKQVTRSLRRYDAERLSVYKHKGIYCSEPMEFMGFLLNGKWQRVAIAQAPLRKLLPATRPFWGNETFEIRTPTSNHFGAILGIGSYPDETSPVFLSELLKAEFDFVLTQSFSFIKQEAARKQMKTARNRMNSASDDAVSQIEEIGDALDDLASRRVVMGEHHFTLVVKANTTEALKNNVATAVDALGDAGITAAREDLAIIAAFWSQFPGQFKDRPRVSGINSRNFSGFAPLHNFPAGRLHNNHWGDALTMYMTTAGTPYYFSFHSSDPQDKNDAKIKDVGHTMVLGPTGSGKTAWVAFNLCMLVKAKATCVLFTKDRDTELVIRALGGRYYPVKIGTPTNWNPFKLDDANPLTMPILKKLTLYLASPGGDASKLEVPETNEVESAVNKVMCLPYAARRIGRVLDFLTKDSPVYQRLQRWCFARETGRKDGENAWVFDNVNDALAETLGQNLITGFDVTAFINNDELRAPINMYLFHLVNMLVDGRRFALFIAEFWKVLGDAPFQSFVEDQLKTIRKNNGFVVLDSQSPNDALKHPISDTLIEQTPNKVLFPNDKARWEQYEKLGVAEREFQIVKESDPESTRSFLLKQGHSSVFASLDLHGFDFELDVLSSKKVNLNIVDELRAIHGDEPENWLPHFKAARRKS
ncbi:VirB4 family type IV secretion/conjugal transfer ATPase [Pseudomonas cedrina]|uniref:VirB4 family type IV secretion/conjugal transfer ATPase n=1 Tax=Pseudomonas cedrina TaxID=651740 RepID=UPI003EDA8E84